MFLRPTVSCALMSDGELVLRPLDVWFSPEKASPPTLCTPLELSGTELCMLACPSAVVHSPMVLDPEDPSSVFHGLLRSQALPDGCSPVSGSFSSLRCLAHSFLILELHL